MNDSGYSGVDILGIIFLLAALAAFTWALRIKSLSANDEEASRVLLSTKDGLESERAGGLAADAALTPPRKRALVAVFAIVLTLMVLMPLVTVIMAFYSASHPGHGFVYPNPH